MGYTHTCHAGSIMSILVARGFPLNIPMLAWLVLAVSVGCSALWLLWYFRPAARWQIRTLIKQSRRSYAKKEYDQALEQVKTARSLALCNLGETSTVYARVLVHV